jgi:hypothetical protein
MLYRYIHIHIVLHCRLKQVDGTHEYKHTYIHTDGEEGVKIEVTFYYASVLCTLWKERPTIISLMSPKKQVWSF